jgi:hypothetical protein
MPDATVPPGSPAPVTQTSPAAAFTCSICGEPSGTICCWCTKDACENHVCVKCRRCSDCCDCDQRSGGPAGGGRGWAS